MGPEETSAPFLTMTSGCEWMAKSFKVPMHEKHRENPCLDCINNKYRGGDIEKCDNCEGYNHHETKRE